MSDPSHPQNEKPSLSRRDALRLAGAVSLGMLAQGCANAAAVPPAPEHPPAPNPAPAAVHPSVAIAQVQSYDRAALGSALASMLDLLGGMNSVVKPGDTVAIKPNLTGGVHSGALPGVAPVESFITHPEVVRALIALVKQAGAKAIYVVESVYEWDSYRQWGYEALQAPGVTLLDLNSPKPFADFESVSVGNDSFIYPEFLLNRMLTQVDVFMSVSKLKNHYNAGVTHTMKNLFGLAPLAHYRAGAGDTYRSNFHGSDAEMPHRIPRVVVDLNRARPIHLSLIDGIKSMQGGEGPWISQYVPIAPIAPGVLIAGKNPVATDAVATAVMGYDPTAEYPQTPFLRGDNHLNLAAARGLGTNRLEDIQVLGAPLDRVKTQFKMY